LLRKIQELEEKLLETQLQLERVTDEKLTHMLSIQKSPTDKTGLEYVAPSSDTHSTSRTIFVKPAVLDPPPTVENKGKTSLMEMFRALRSPLPSEDLLYAIIAVLVDMSNPSAPYSKPRKQKSRKKCRGKQIMAQDL
jgi:siderophore synthetase component